MEPTARAEEIIRHLSPALDSLSSALSLTHDFDPSVSTMTFRIGLSDDVEFGLLPPLLRALRQEAPKVVFVVQHVDYWRIPDLLASGDITVGITQTPWPAGECQAQVAAPYPPALAARRRVRPAADPR